MSERTQSACITLDTKLRMAEESAYATLQLGYELRLSTSTTIMAKITTITDAAASSDNKK